MLVIINFISLSLSLICLYFLLFYCKCGSELCWEIPLIFLSKHEAFENSKATLHWVNFSELKIMRFYIALEKWIFNIFEQAVHLIHVQKFIRNVKSCKKFLLNNSSEVLIFRCKYLFWTSFEIAYFFCTHNLQKKIWWKSNSRFIEAYNFWACMFLTLKYAPRLRVHMRNFAHQLLLAV